VHLQIEGLQRTTTFFASVQHNMDTEIRYETRVLGEVHCQLELMCGESSLVENRQHVTVPCGNLP
jgi:hypothetical protein